MAPRAYTLGKRAQSVEDTRRRIIDATFELHNQKGILATSVKDIAERADVALRTVYLHYPTINDLVQGCAYKVIDLLRPPSLAIFEGVTGLEPRLQTLTTELFSMYERGTLQLETARCQQGQIPALAGFLENAAAMHEVLVREALRPSEGSRRAVSTALALTDFYVWKSFHQRGLSTHQAAGIVAGLLVASVSPPPAEKGQAR